MGERDDPFAALDAAQQSFDAVAEGAQLGGQPWTPELVRFLSVSLLAFSTVALIIASILLWKSKASPQHVLRVFGILSIVGVSALLLVAGYSNDQLTPIVGLFGAIAGYLLGKDVQYQGDST